MTKVVNRFTIMTGAACMIMASMFPPIGAFFASLPDPVLGGCTVMMFGAIMVSGIQMMGRLQMTQRNATIAALSFSIGIGTTTATENAIWHIFPQVVQDVFSGNCVAVVYVVAILLDTFLPANMEAEKLAEAEAAEENEEPAFQNI
jgi:NCS2 family nucleobase:cation symporter-2